MQDANTGRFPIAEEFWKTVFKCSQNQTLVVRAACCPWTSPRAAWIENCSSLGPWLRTSSERRQCPVWTSGGLALCAWHLFRADYAWVVLKPCAHLSPPFPGYNAVQTLQLQPLRKHWYVPYGLQDFSGAWGEHSSVMGWTSKGRAWESIGADPEGKRVS